MAAGFSFSQAQPTPLLGRETELEEITERLAGRKARLLTLTGPPGVGKTRLAIEACNRVASSFPDGIVFADLTPVRDPDLVLLKIAERLGITNTAAPSLPERLGASLGEMLLVLDNLEQVLPAAAEQLADLLAAAPGFTMLVTSRIPLQLSWEQVIRIAPLAVPDPGTELPLAELARIPAVALFVERARAQRAGFELTEDQAPLVAQLVRQLDGLPLALELAAARLDVLPLEVITGELADRVRLLRWDARDRPMKHRSLEAAIGWSYDLLPENEKQCFRHSGVFMGRVSLHAAEAVAEVEDERQVLPVMASLAARSLILPAQEDEDGEPSFGMLETVREYAWEQLESHDELERARAAHARYFLELAERANPELTGRRQRLWFGRLEREHDNLRAAQSYLLDRGDHEAALRLVGAIGWFWLTRGYHAEGLHWLEKTLKITQDADPSLRIAALLRAGFLLSYQGNVGRSQAVLEEAMTLAKEREDEYAIAESLTYLGVSSVVAGNIAAGVSTLTEALSRWRELGQCGDNLQFCLTMFYLGVPALARNDVRLAASLFSEALECYETNGDSRSASGVRFHLALTTEGLGDLDRAVQLVREGLCTAKDFQDRVFLSLALEVTLVLAGDRVDPEQRGRLLGGRDALRRPLHLGVGYLERILGSSVPGIHEQLSVPATSPSYQEGRSLSFAEVADLTEALLDHISGTLAGPLEAASEQTRVNPLTEREQEVLQLVAGGLTSREIGKQLFISRRTVDHYLSSILYKLRVKTRAQAAAVAVQEGLF